MTQIGVLWATGIKGTDFTDRRQHLRFTSGFTLGHTSFYYLLQSGENHEPLKYICSIILSHR